MCDKSLDVLSVLRKNQLINSKTIDSLISYGFDSNDSLNALDFDLDFPQMNDISSQQKSILKQILNELNVGFNCESILYKINENNYQLNEELSEESTEEMREELNDLNEEFPYLNKLFEKELKSKELREKQLKEEIKELEQNISLNEKLFKEDINENINQLKSIKNSLIIGLKNLSKKNQNKINVKSVLNSNNSEVNNSSEKPIKQKNVKSITELKDKTYVQNINRFKNKKKILGTNIVKSKERLKSHLNISNKEENILLSCKGLMSSSKIRQYYERQVIDGQKVFMCRWKEEDSVCQFQSYRCHVIARHINLSHIGVEFKCPKAFCNKVFKNPNSYREHMKNHFCGFGLFGYGSNGVIGVCCNQNINRYRNRVVIGTKKFYRCIYIVNGSQCGSITKYHMAIKRHIHSHTCPYRKNLKQNREVIQKMKCDTWNLNSTFNSLVSGNSLSTDLIPEIKAEFLPESKPLDNKKTYQCRRTNCTQTFERTADLLKHENQLCEYIKNGLTQTLVSNKKMGKYMPTITNEELISFHNTSS